MNAIKWGLLAGLVIGLVIAFGSFTQLIVVAFFTLVGAGVGWLVGDRVDLGELLNRRRR